MYDDLITNARELCDAARDTKARGSIVDSAALSWAITNNCVPQLCDALVAMTARAEKAEAERDAANKCIYDTETYFDLGANKFAYRTIKQYTHDAAKPQKGE